MKLGRAPATNRYFAVVSIYLARRGGSEKLARVFVAVSEQFAELPRRKAGIPDNAAHSERVHGVVERLDCPKVRDPGYLRHPLRRDFHFPQILLTGQLPGDFDVFADRLLDVCQSLRFSGALRPAAGQAGTRNAVPLFGWHQSNWVLHTSDCNM